MIDLMPSKRNRQHFSGLRYQEHNGLDPSGYPLSPAARMDRMEHLSCLLVFLVEMHSENAFRSIVRVKAMTSHSIFAVAGVKTPAFGTLPAKLEAFRLSHRAIARLWILILILISEGCPVAEATINYSYDRLGRLTSAAYENGVCLTYSYDANGNRTVISSIIAPVGPPTWGAAPFGCFNWTAP
jgi:YD repeat-containing protein